MTNFELVLISGSILIGFYLVCSIFATLVVAAAVGEDIRYPRYYERAYTIKIGRSDMMYIWGWPLLVVWWSTAGLRRWTSNFFCGIHAIISGK